MIHKLRQVNPKQAVVEDRWAHLRQFTAARIGLGRAGISLPTKHLLEFQLAHARAQDAVHHGLDADKLQQQLTTREWAKQQPILNLQSAAKNRQLYLQRPDWGRRLNQDSAQQLMQQPPQAPYDLVIAIVDGLSALAIESNSLPFLDALVPQLLNAPEPWSLGPLCLVQQGRVAIGDHIGELLNARAVLVLIGERPGLSSPDSLGLYLTWNPQTGYTDAQRNCISNIRPEGLPYEEASHRAFYLLQEAREKKISGVQIKDRSEDNKARVANSEQNFLTSP